MYIRKINKSLILRVAAITLENAILDKRLGYARDDLEDFKSTHKNREAANSALKNSYINHIKSMEDKLLIHRLKNHKETRK